MNDVYLGDVGAPEGDGQSPPPIADATAQPTAPEPITKLEFEKFKAELADEIKRTIQSQTGKAESRIKKDVESKLAQVEANFKSLREAGYPVTDEDLKAARSQAMRETLASLPGEDDAAQRNQPAPNPERQAVANDTMKALRSLQKQYGYVLTENDPEYWDLVDADVAHAESPTKFLEMHEAKLREVVTRLGRPVPPPSQPAQIGNPAARIPAPVGTPTGGNIEALNNELGVLLNKHNLTPAEDRRRKEIEAELLKHVPRK